MLNRYVLSPWFAMIPMKLFDQRALLSLIGEFRTSMRILLADICEDLNHYPALIRRLRLPVGLFRLIGGVLEREDYSNWKVVGWIETLNELLYFVDLHHQLTTERDQVEFAEQVYAECQEKFYENSYADELFPDGMVGHRDLSGRLLHLCRRLSRDIVQQAILFYPGLACDWISNTGVRRWSVACDLRPNFDRAELPWCLPVGLDGTCYCAPLRIRKVLSSAGNKARMIVSPRGFVLTALGHSYPVYARGSEERWYWKQHAPTVIRRSPLGTLTLGPTLEYGRQRTPQRVRPTSSAVAKRIQQALSVVKEAWAEGDQLLTTLTSRIIPLRAKGVVSFSYRHQPGLSFINCFDRDDLDLIDDLIHENGHHHLNLLLRKYVLYRDDRNQEIFYSPWRRRLRPLRGILHATFTFTMGALLFERLSTWGSRPIGSRAGTQSRLSMQNLRRARFRCTEELESVRYALQDLHRADRQLGWIPQSGKGLIGQLSRTLSAVSRRIDRHTPSVHRSRYGAVLRRHQQELRRARRQYGSLRL